MGGHWRKGVAALSIDQRAGGHQARLEREAVVGARENGLGLCSTGSPIVVSVPEDLRLFQGGMQSSDYFHNNTNMFAFFTLIL